MNKQKVMKLIGKENWPAFDAWMHGQTIGIKKGKPDYYEWDIKDFIRQTKIDEKQRKISIKEAKQLYASD